MAPVLLCLLPALSEAQVKTFRSRNAIFAIPLLLLPHLLAQNNAAPRPITEAEVRRHLKIDVPAVYPPIAKAAHIEGDVTISILIDVKGKVTSEKVLSGPSMLQQAAVDAVKQWEFTPFTTDGVEAPVTAQVSLSFKLGQSGPQPTAEQQAAAQAWFRLSDACRATLAAQKADEALDFCKQALDMSMKAGDLTSSDQLARLDSHQFYGHALLMSGRAEDALDQENQAFIEALKCVTDQDEEYAGPLFWRAIAEANLGKDEAALNDFLAAESTLRHAMANLPDMRKNYKEYLAAVMKQHAMLLDRMGKKEQADKLRADAAAL